MKIENLFKALVSEKFETPNYQGATLKLAQKFGAKKLGFHIEIMNPKQFSAPYHYHTHEEEMFLILEGEAIVRRENQFRKVGPGDLIFYETGPGSVHNMYNHTDKPLKMLCISNDDSDHDLCFYPDSKKELTPNGVMQNGKKVDYYKDEEDPSKYWPEHALRGEV